MGLSDEEVNNNRKKYGTNKITEKKKKTFINLLLESLTDPIIKILLIALSIKIVVLFRSFDWYETIGILIAIFLASFISSISEYASEKSFNKLQEVTDNIIVNVKRNGSIKEISLNDLVVNDLVILKTGDKIPADGIIISGSLIVDESALNGEVSEAKKEINSKIYRGSIIYNGSATMKITSVGDNTIIGKISQELQEKIPISPLKLKLRKLAKIISRIGYIGAFLASFTYLFSKIVIDNSFDINLIVTTLRDFPLMFDYLLYALTLCVTIIVVAVPEGLPMMITLVLSSNMKRMLKDNVLVRKLVGIETSGSLNILFTDKTGTLTKGLLKVTNTVLFNGMTFNNINELSKYKIYDIICNSLYYNNESYISDNKIIGGNTTDRALMEYVKNIKISKRKIKSRVLFDSNNKYSSILLDDGFYYYKGASEIIVPKCKKYVDINGNIKDIESLKYFQNKIANYTKKAGRVIVLAYGKTEDDLILIGFVNIKDELRKEALEGINIIKKAGINIIMITGDAKETASSIAKELGLISKDKYMVLDSHDLNMMSDSEIAKKIDCIAVIARALPQDKSRLVSICENKGLVVGMTGDGVNDAPALKKANVGFAMGSGMDVAKEAADIVILDNNILSISKAILYGRTIFKSIRKFIIYQLTVNMCALCLSIVGSLIGISTPITIVQMLWLNMIMDTFAGVAFSYEAPSIEYMEELPKKKDTPIINKYMYSQIIWTGIYCALVCILFLKLPIFRYLIRQDSNNRYLMTSYFAMFIFMGIFNAFNARSTRINIFANLSKNKVFIFVFAFIFITQIYIIYNGGDIFRTYGLNVLEFGLAFFIALSVFPIDILRKLILKKKKIKLNI